MLKNKKTILVIAIVLALVGVFIWILLSGEAETKTAPTQPTGNLVTFDGSTITEEQNGKTAWSVSAEQIKVNPKTKEIYLTNMKGTFYDGDKTLVVTAPRGYMSGDHNKMQLAGGVKGTNGADVELTTESISFDNKTKKLTSETPFTFSNSDAVVTGDQLEADTVLNKVMAKGHAKLVKK